MINDILPGRPLSPLPPLIPSRPAERKKETQFNYSLIKQNLP
jgi:hypothetical protein